MTSSWGANAPTTREVTRMSHSIVNPTGLHDPVPFGYSHTATIPAGAELVLVAGQWGSSTDGTAVSTDFAEQVRRAFHNLGVALAAHGLDLSHVVQLRTYVVNHDFDKLGAIAVAVQGGWGATPPTHTVIGVASLATPDIQFEVEAIAARS
jgi:enamine deaminase RidA (YjgF/YER057c/UK114 family)